MDQKKIVLFGCGEIGYRLLQYFGKERVFAFCDNSCVIRDVKYGVNLISYDEFKSVADDYILIISVNPKNAGEIINQLIGDGIRDFVVYDSMFWSETKRNPPDRFLKLLNDDKERVGRTRDYLFRRLNYKTDQLEYLKSISDIHKLKPAKGYVSAVQRELKLYVKTVFEMLSDLAIKPFTVAGTAIGLYRHNGFIPWDDDVDFGLFRCDYMKLIDYGKKHFPYLEVSLGLEGDCLQAEYFLKYPDQNIMIISPNCLQIKKGTSWIDSNTIDFFPYDFYEDNFPYEDHIKNIKDCSTWRRFETGSDRILEFIKIKGSTCKESDTISFGLDSMDPYVCPKNGWMKRDVMLPLQKTIFEGIQCYKPNNIKEYLSYCYEDFENYPSDMGALHSWDLEEKMKRFYISMMIVVEDENFMKFVDLYQKLRSKGIYCLFMLNSTYLADSSNYEIIRKMITDAEIQYMNDIDDEFDCYIASNNVRRLLAEDKTVYDVSNDLRKIYDSFIEDFSRNKFDPMKTRLCLLDNKG